MEALCLNDTIRATHNPSLCGASSKGACAKSVRMFLEAGGMNTAGRPGSACQYKYWLPSKGFQLIARVNGVANQDAWTKTNARPGDIAVMDHGQHGHICLWNGQAWCSDFVQRKAWPYPGDGTIYIFRFAGKATPLDPNLLGEYSVGGATGMDTELNGESFIDACPGDLVLKGLWTRYQLRMGLRSAVLKDLLSNYTDDSTANISVDMNYKPTTTAEMERNGLVCLKHLISNLHLTPEQAAGIVGCWMAESRCDPHAFNKQEKAGTFKGSSANGGGYGAGLAQWSHGRKQDLQKLIGRKDPIESWDLNTQLAAACLEMTKGCKSKFPDTLRQARDVLTATDLALRGYENGGNGSLASIAAINKYTWCGGHSGALTTRHAFAKRVLDLYAST